MKLAALSSYTEMENSRLHSKVGGVVLIRCHKAGPEPAASCYRWILQENAAATRHKGRQVVYIVVVVQSRGLFCRPKRRQEGAVVIDFEESSILIY